MYFRPPFTHIYDAPIPLVCCFICWILASKSYLPFLRANSLWMCSCLLKNQRFFFFFSSSSSSSSSFWQFWKDETTRDPSTFLTFLSRSLLSTWNQFVKDICVYTCIKTTKKNHLKWSLRWFIEFETRCIELVQSKLQRYSTYSSVLH